MSSQNKREKNYTKEEEIAAQQEIWKHIFGFTPLAVIKCAIELMIPDILENRETPITLVELSSELKCPQSLVNRIMRFLINYKIFQETPISETCVGYVKTPISRILTRNGKNSMADMVLLNRCPTMLAPWQKLRARVQGDEVLPFEAAHKTDLWGFIAANPGYGKLFQNAMASNARMVVMAVVKGCLEVFEGLRTVVDVGGSDGTALRLIVEACPWIKGINFDLPHVVVDAPMCKNVEHVGGDMFDQVPKADAVYLMNVLHDWADEECIDILRNCRAAIPKDTGKVIIVEAIMGQNNGDEFNDTILLFDMAMMAYTSKGKERTLKEWSYILHQAGFTVTISKRIQAYQSLMEVYP